MPLLTKRELFSFINDCWIFTIWLCLTFLAVIQGKTVPAIIGAIFCIWIVCAMIQRMILPNHKRYEKIITITGTIILLGLIATLFT